MIVDKIVNGKNEKYDEHILKHVQNIFIMMLKEFNDICEQNNIEYYLCGGTALGAIRHEGFIPWDDDVDVMMFRKDYDELFKLRHEFEDKYDFLSIETTENYYRHYTKISLKNTKTNEFWERNCDFTLGISLDIYVIDFLPRNKFKQKLFIDKWKLYNKLSLILEITTVDLYYSKNKQILGRMLRKFLEIFKLNQKFLIKQREKLGCNEKDSVEVMILVDGNLNMIYPIQTFHPPHIVRFEGLNLPNPHDYDFYLKVKYGDYMRIPSNEERENHSFDIEFGPY